jgi:DNA-binding response OmpR family regulator
MPQARPLVAIVNDEAAFVRILDALLQDEGFDALLQAGEVAYESIKQQRPKLIVLDINTAQPEASWKTVDLLVVDPATTDIPMILCTVADQTYRDRQPKLLSLAHILIEKPFALSELVEHIRAQLGRGDSSS